MEEKRNDQSTALIILPFLKNIYFLVLLHLGIKYVCGDSCSDMSSLSYLWIWGKNTENLPSEGDPWKFVIVHSDTWNTM